MSVRCPDGHLSQSDDYCDVCGLPIGAAATGAAPNGAGAAGGGAAGPTSVLDLGHQPPSAPGPGTGAPEKTCPNCQSQVPEDDLFCEVCGYDFTTGALPAPVTLPGAVVASSAGSAAQLGGPAVQTPAPNSPAGSSSAPSSPSARPTHPDKLDWVAEIWVDPDWYSTQESDDPCPSAGLPAIVPLWDTSVLVGRTSRSRDIHPQVDAGADHGVSRRHAQLTTDGRHWWAEDLESANGTFIAPAGAPLPTTPIPAHQRTEFSPGDRIYVGAWTRVVVRNATPDER